MNIMAGKTITFSLTEPWEEEQLKKIFKNHKLLFFPATIDSTINIDKIKNAEILSVFVDSTIDKKVLDQMPKLKFIATRSTGFDHIDLKECAKRKITVSNVPSYGENTVAEHTFALILNISRRIFDSVERTRKGAFEYEGLRGFDLKGKTIGVLGTGRIGMHVIQIAKGFEMNVVAYDLYPNKEMEKKLGFRYLKTVNAVLSASDVVTLHTPYTKETHHLISLKNLSKIKKGCVLINTARGKLVETAALIKGLQQRIISAAGLDVLEEEAFLKEERQLLSKEFAKKYDLKTVLEEHVLTEHPNVFITPHNAFNSKEAIQRILNATIENIDGFLKGKPVNVVK